MSVFPQVYQKNVKTVRINFYRRLNVQLEIPLYIVTI